MIENALAILVVGYLVLQLIEHVIFPVVWSLFQRRKVSMCDLAGMVGKTGVVKEWNGEKGKILVEGGIWSATGGHRFDVGDKVEVDGLDGFNVIVKPVAVH